MPFVGVYKRLKIQVLICERLRDLVCVFGICIWWHYKIFVIEDFLLLLVIAIT